MAVTIVQSKAGTGSGAATHTAAFTSATTTGNTIVVGIVCGIRTGGSNTLTTSSVSDGGTNTYTRWVASSESHGAGTHYSASLSEFWYCENITGHAATVTITVTPSATTDGAICIYELSASTHDQASVGTGTSAAASSSSLTPSAAGAAVLASAFSDDGFGSGGPTAGTNFTIDLKSGFSNEDCGTEHWLQTTATATTGPMTLPTSGTWVASQAIFVPPGGGGAVIPKTSPVVMQAVNRSLTY